MRRRALRRRYGRAVCPSGSEVQSLLFDRRFFGVERAKAWARKHNRKYGDVDVKDDFIHLRQEDPSLFSRYATVHFGRRGVSARVGWKHC